MMITVKERNSRLQFGRNFGRASRVAFGRFENEYKNEFPAKAKSFAWVCVRLELKFAP